MATSVAVPYQSTPIPAYYAVPNDLAKHPAIILIHDHIKDIADRLQTQGYIVLAPDLLSESGVTDKISPQLLQEMQDPAKKDEAQKKLREILSPIHAPDFAEKTIAKLQACFTYLKNQNNVSSIGVIGFCFGGTYSFSLAAVQPELKAAVPFYGHAPEPLEKVKTINCPVLAFYGEKDTQLVAKVDELNEAMGQFHKPFEAVVYPDCGHAFFNDTNPNMYFKEAADDAWGRLLEFLKINLV
jgi:carboxymethylenebutenolidase